MGAVKFPFVVEALRQAMNVGPNWHEPSDCPDCDGFGTIWNNADPTSGQCVECDCGDTRGLV